MSIRRRLVVSFVVVLALTIISFIVATWAMQAMHTGFSEIVEETAPSVRALHHLHSTSLGILQLSMEHVMAAFLAHEATHDHAEMHVPQRGETRDFVELSAALDEWLGTYISDETDEDDALFVSQVSEASLAFWTKAQEILDIELEDVDDVETLERLNAELVELQQLERTFAGMVEEALAEEFDEFEESQDDMLSRSNTVRAVYIAASVLTVGGFAVVALLLANHLVQPLSKLTDAAEMVSTGEMDVVVDVQSKDELGKLASVFNQMVVHRRAAHDELEARVQERTAELETANVERERLQQEIIDAQKQTLRELSSPVIPVMDGIIVVPLVGNIDTTRAQDITRGLLDGITRHRARVAIVDITGVSMIDSGVADYLNKTIQAARLKGVRTIITGISNAVAEAVVDLGIDWSGLDTLGDLQTGLRVALASTGMKLS